MPYFPRPRFLGPLHACIALALVGTGLTATACTETITNLHYCSNTNGDGYCEQHHPGEELHCVLAATSCWDQMLTPEQRSNPDFDGCVASMPEPECHSPCGGQQSADEAVGCYGPPEGTGTGGTDDSPSTGGNTGLDDGTWTDGGGSEETTDSDEGSTGEPDPCGNEILDPGEECDPTVFEAVSCESLGLGPGMLECTALCELDLTGCGERGCGNDERDGMELCDGTDLVGFDCTTFGFDDGTLACADDCSAFDTTACIGCGDGMRNGGEECDGSDLDGQTCDSLGIIGGGASLSCTAGCTFDFSGCIGCGDGMVNGTEECDGLDLDGETCASQGIIGVGAPSPARARRCALPSGRIKKKLQSARESPDGEEV